MANGDPLKQSGHYRPLSSFFGCMLIAWSAAAVLLDIFADDLDRLAGSTATDSALKGFFLRLAASDYEIGMVVIFAGVLLYAILQAVAVAGDTRILAGDTPSVPVWLSIIADRAAGRSGAGWNEFNPKTRFDALRAHVHYGGAASITPLRIALWLFPMLGFLGTVIGLSQAIHGLSAITVASKGASLSSGDLGPVLNDLHLAFDTTILGIVAAVVVMVPITGLERAWDRLGHWETHLNGTDEATPAVPGERRAETVVSPGT